MINLLSKNILLVEDDPLIAVAESKTIEKMGYTVIIANSGETALQIALDGSQSFNLILMDNNLGQGMGGIETAKAILEKCNKPVVFFTSDDNPEFVQSALQITQYGIVNKSSGKLVLESVIRMALQLFDAEERARISALQVQTLTNTAVKNQADIFKQIFEDSQTIMLLIDPVSGAIVDSNPSAAKFYGYERSKLSTMNITEINMLPPEEVALARQRAMRETNATFTFPHRLANQEIRFVEVHSSPVTLPVQNQNQTKQFLFSIIHDITERKRAEDELRKLMRVVEQSPASVMITDATGAIEFVNEKFCQVSGYSFAEVIGKNPDILQTDQLTPAENASMWDQLRHGKTWLGEFKNRKKNGEYFWESAIIFPLMDEKGKITHFAAIKEDITSQRQMELNLRAAENRYQALFVSSQDSIFITEPCGKILEANPAAERLFGYTLDEFLQIGRDNLMDTSDPRLAAALEERQKTGQFSGELTAIHKDGSRFPCEISSAIYTSADGSQKSSVFLRDITGRKRAEKELFESEEKYRLLFQNMHEGFALHEIILDEDQHPVDFRFLDANSAYERHTGFTATNVIGKTMLELMPEADRKQIEAYGKVALGGASLEFEYYSNSFNRYFRITAFSPQPGRFATIFEDVTKRKTADIEIQNLLKEKELLLREVHHRIKNNMTTIIGLLEAQRGYLTDPDIALEDASGRVRSMMTLYDQLYRSADYEHISTELYFAEMLEQTRQIWERPGIQIQLSGEIENLDLTPRMMYPIGMIVNEWLTNAYKYAFPDNHPGTITLKVKTTAPGWLEISVTDDGVGMSASPQSQKPESFGANLVRVLAQQLESELYIFNENGVHNVLRIPLGKTVH